MFCDYCPDILCYNCESIPLITFNPNNPRTVNMKCLCSDYHDITIFDYWKFNEVKLKMRSCCINSDDKLPFFFCRHCVKLFCKSCFIEHTKNIQFINLCWKNHFITRRLDYYCFNCKMDLCVECSAEHSNKGHFVVYLKNFKISPPIDKNYIEFSFTQIFGSLHIPAIQCRNNDNNRIYIVLKTILINSSNANFWNYNAKLNYMRYYPKLNRNFIYHNKDINVPLLINLNPYNQIEKDFVGIKIHNDAVTHLIQLSHDRIATASLDRSIKILAQENLKEVLCIENAHKNRINALVEIEGNIIMSCASKSIKLWIIEDDNTFKLKKTIKVGHFIHNIIKLRNNRLAINLNEGIEIWESISPFNRIKRIEKMDICSMMQMKHRELLIVSDPNRISFYNSDNYQNVFCLLHISCKSKEGIKEISKEKIIVHFMTLGQLVVINVNTFQKETVISHSLFLQHGFYTTRINNRENINYIYDSSYYSTFFDLGNESILFVSTQSGFYSFNKHTFKIEQIDIDSALCNITSLVKLKNKFIMITYNSTNLIIFSLKE